MILKKLRTKTRRVAVTLPQQLSQVTLGQLMQMQSAQNLGDLQAISILSGIPLTDLQNISNADDLQPMFTQVSAIAHQLKYLYNSDAIPKEITFNINGKPRKVKVIKNLSIEPAGAFMTSREIIAGEISKHMQKHGDDDLENFSPSLQASAQILAQYFYCRATGKPYNEYAAAEFEEQVKLLPVTEALPIAKYFFLNYPNLSKPKTSFWHRLHRLWSNGRALKTSNRLNTSTPLTPSPVAM